MNQINCIYKKGRTERKGRMEKMGVGEMRMMGVGEGGGGRKGKVGGGWERSSREWDDEGRDQ